MPGSETQNNGNYLLYQMMVKYLPNCMNKTIANSNDGLAVGNGVNGRQRIELRADSSYYELLQVRELIFVSWANLNYL